MRDKPKPLFKQGESGSDLDLDWIDDKEWAFVSGFSEAASIVAERAIETRAAGRTLFYPIAFLFRHSIELELKRILSLIDQREGQPPKKRDTHSIGDLWNALQHRLGQYMPKAWIERATQIDSVLREIERRDPDAQQGRYPETSRGEAFKGLKGLDLPHFVDVAEETITTLIGIEAHLTEIFEFNDEQRAEFEAQFRAELQAEYGY